MKFSLVDLDGVTCENKVLIILKLSLLLRYNKQTVCVACHQVFFYIYSHF